MTTPPAPKGPFSPGSWNLPGGLQSSPRLGAGGGCNPGCHPPGSRSCVGGGGVAPSPSLPDRSGGGENIGAARPRQQHSDWLTQVTCQPLPFTLPPPPRGPFFQRFPGVAHGPRGPRGRGLSPETQRALMPLLLHMPGFLSRCRRPCPPHSPLRTGSAWLPQPGNVHSAGARVRPDWGRGKERRRPRAQQQCAGVWACPVAPVASLGARAVGGAEAGAAR